MCQSVPIWPGPRRSRFVCLLILLSSLILRISVSTPVKQNEQAMSYRISNVLPNRRNTAIRSMFFFLLYNAHCLYAHRVSLCHQAMCGEQKKKIRVIKFGNYMQTLQIWTPLPIGAGCIVASIYWRSASIPILNY